MTTLHEFYDPKAAKEALNEYHPNIEVDLRKQPGLYAYFNSLLAQAENQYDRFKHLVDVAEATLDKETRAAAAKSGAKTSEAVIKAAITSNPSMKKVVRMMLEAKMQVNLLKGTCIGLVQRKDTLLQIARNELAEKQSNPLLFQSKVNKGERHEKVNALLNYSTSNVEDTESSDSTNDDTGEEG